MNSDLRGKTDLEDNMSKGQSKTNLKSRFEIMNDFLKDVKSSVVAFDGEKLCHLFSLTEIPLNSFQSLKKYPLGRYSNPYFQRLVGECHRVLALHSCCLFLLMILIERY